jgi:hypothetical protein
MFPFKAFCLRGFRGHKGKRRAVKAPYLFRSRFAQRSDFTFHAATFIDSLFFEQKCFAPGGAEEIKGGLGLILEQNTLDLDGLFGIGRIGKTPADHARNLVDCQREVSGKAESPY